MDEGKISGWKFEERLSRRPCLPFRVSRTALACSFLGLIWLAGIVNSPLFAQQTLRPSLSAASNASRQQFPETGYDYNLQLGPAFLKLGASLGVEYNDNINLADSRNTGAAAPQSDFIYRPELDLTTTWPVSKLNVVTFNLGLGLERHLNHPEADQTRVVISPGSQLSFDVYTGPFRFNFHDQFSVQQNPTSQGSVSNTSQYGQISNTTGVSALCDLNKIIFQAGLDYGIVRYTGSGYNSSDSNSTIFNVSAAIPYNAAITAGLQANYTHTVYTAPLQPVLDSYGGGPFLNLMVTKYTSLQASAGYEVLDSNYANGAPQTLASLLGTSSSASTSAAPYYSFGIQSRLNRYLSHSLTVGRERQLGLATNYLDLEYVRYNFTWRVNSHLTLAPSFFYEHGNQAGLLNAEIFDRYGVQIAFSYQLTRHLSAGIHYSYIRKNSGLPFNGYVQNVIGIQLGYDF
jgi:hypothetical protein